MPAKPGRVTLSDVAEAAGVDVSLVSRVLRGEEIGARSETRERIKRHAAQMGYRPNAAARSLRTARAHAYGLVIPDFTNPVYAEIISGAEAAAAERNCVLLTGSGAGWNRADWYQALGNGRVDGMLITGGSKVDLDALDVPSLLVNRTYEKANRYVVLADEEAAGMAVDHLVALGHRHIAHLGGPDHADTAQRRRKGYRHAMDHHGLHPYLEVTGDFSAAGGAEAAQQLADEREMTAVVAANVASAIGAMQALKSRGREIPSDVSIVAIHDASLAGFLSPPLTTVAMPLAEMGARAIGLLADTPRDQSVHEVVKEPMSLVTRGSTAPANR